MARKSKEVVRETGLYKNGNRWWTRVRSPVSGVVKPLSTGTDDLALANSVKQMVDAFAEDRPMYEWLDRAVRGDALLLELYNRWRRGELSQLAAELAAQQTAESDGDMRVWVERWVRDVLPKRVTKRGAPLSDGQISDNARHLLALVPADAPLPCSALTEEYASDKLVALGVSRSTQRNYVSSWRPCVRWARRKGAPIPVDPFEYAEEWVPSPSKPRDKVWTHTERLLVLDYLDGPAKAAIALMLGSGMELSALRRLRGKDVSHDGSRTAYADGRKTEYRSRHVTVDQWAWDIFVANAPSAIGSALVFEWKAKGSALRKSFYRAQVRAGLCEAAPRSDNGYELWTKTDIHTIHDCRHTYAVCRGYGLDGEPKRDEDYISNQLGHGSTEMTSRVYKNLSAARRRQFIAEGERAQAAAAAMHAAAAGAR